VRKPAAVVESEIIWKGPDSLRQFLVPIATLEPFPNNPRVGDIDAIAAALDRFGQLKPIVIDGNRIVAGHHLTKGAEKLGWTHVAAAHNEFADEDEARAFLLADNRTSEIGHFDTELLVGHLRDLEEIGKLEGTGYSNADFDWYMAQMEEIGKVDLGTEIDPIAVEVRSPDAIKEIVLFYSEEQHAQVALWLQQIAEANRTSGVSETVYSALEIAAAAADAPVES